MARYWYNIKEFEQERAPVVSDSQLRYRAAHLGARLLKGIVSNPEWKIIEFVDREEETSITQNLTPDLVKLVERYTLMPTQSVTLYTGLERDRRSISIDTYVGKERGDLIGELVVSGDDLTKYQSTLELYPHTKK